MKNEVIETKAQALLDKYEIDASNGYDIILLAEKMGFEVGNTDLEDDDDGFIAVDKSKETLFGTKSNKVIGVNVTRDYYLKRFTVAHELGHYVLEGEGKSLYAHRDSKTKQYDDKETTADFFAANLLMPKEAFSAKYYEILPACAQRLELYKQLQNIFEAPLNSVIRRIDELQLVAGKE